MQRNSTFVSLYFFAVCPKNIEACDIYTSEDIDNAQMTFTARDRDESETIGRI